MSFLESAENNIKTLINNPYPGRGMIIGMTPDGKKYVQVYWIMGRSENSRNRIFILENGFVKTKAYDEKKLTDPSLIIYYPVKDIKKSHIVTNGDQTDTVYDMIKENKTFEDAMAVRTFEPDAPNFTPRISGMVDLDDNRCAYKLSILKSIDNNDTYSQRNIFYYEKAIKGFGHFISTYDTDGNPLPSFYNEPKLMQIHNDINVTADLYWCALDDDNKVSLLTKYIDIQTGNFEVLIKNKLENI